jgi:hypothetical protein
MAEDTGAWEAKAAELRRSVRAQRCELEKTTPERRSADEREALRLLALVDQRLDRHKWRMLRRRFGDVYSLEA